MSKNLFSGKISETQTNTVEKVFLILTLLAGIIILLPFINFQQFLSQGDHGRDLYAFQATLNGDTPYRDYLWVYGPLMPYYYAFFYKLLGINIQSVLIGESLLKLISGLFIFLTVRSFARSIWAFLAAAWFWNYYSFFFYTYNHAGGVALMTVLLYCLFQYIHHRQTKSLYIGLACIFFLSLVKLNIGLSALFTFIVSVIIIDKVNKIHWSSKKLFYGISFIGLPLSIFLVYYIFLNGLPLYVIRQCFPYLSDDSQYSSPVSKSLETLARSYLFYVTVSWPSSFFAAIIFFSALSAGLFIFRNVKNDENCQNILLIVLSLILFYIVHLHEFLASGVFYRIAWARPFSSLLLFTSLAVGTRNSPKLIRFSLYGILLLFIFLQAYTRIQDIRTRQHPRHILKLQRSHILLGNDPSWIQTVTITSRFLQIQLKDNETFFALPYDTLYHFLTEKPLPTRQTVFFAYHKVPEAQEQKIIDDLEEKKVNYILMSNRIVSPEGGLGVFGETHCRLLNAYIKENFEVIATFGDWENVPGWAWNHGTKVLRRKGSLRRDITQIKKALL